MLAYLLTDEFLRCLSPNLLEIKATYSILKQFRKEYKLASSKRDLDPMCVARLRKWHATDFLFKTFKNVKEEDEESYAYHAALLG
jgi:hypothetical protein